MSSPDVGGPIDDILYTTTISGQILGDQMQPIAGALVLSSANQTKTDDNGIFWLTETDVFGGQLLITVKAPGYIDGSRKIYATEGSNNFVRIKLLQKVITGSVSASTGGTISNSDNAAVQLPANGFATLDGSPYNGQVNVSLHYLDPTKPSTALEMPGNLTGLNEEGGISTLVSYGMMSVELTAQNGEELQLSTGSQATLRFPVPPSILADAPATIPLWSYDENVNIWIKEDTASLVGNEYIGKVSHFSFWNCDDPYDLVKLSGTITDESGLPVPNFLVTVQISGNQEAGSVYTDDHGFYCGDVPSGLPLKLLLSTPCSNQPIEQDFGPLDTNTDLGPTAIDVNAINISGTVLDCNGDPVTDGYVKFEASSGNAVPLLAPIIDGAYATILPNCANSIDYEIEGVNLESLQTSGDMTYTLMNGSAVDLTVCNPIDGSLVYYNQTFGLTSFDQASIFTLPSGKSCLWARSADSEIQLYFDGQTPGVYRIDETLSRLPVFNLSDDHEMSIQITSFGDLNGQVVGSIGGFLDNAAQQSVTGNFAATNLTTGTDCDFPGLFAGFYKVEQVDASPVFDPAQPYVQDLVLLLEIAGDQIRTINPVSGFNEMGGAHLLFGCDRLIVPYLTAFSPDCSEKLIITQSDEYGSFNPNIDIEFLVRMKVEAVDGGCLDPPVDEITVRFVKQ